PAEFLFCVDRYLEHGRGPLHAHWQKPAPAANDGITVGCQLPSPQIFAECFAHTISVWACFVFSHSLTPGNERKRVSAFRLIVIHIAPSMPFFEGHIPDALPPASISDGK